MSATVARMAPAVSSAPRRQVSGALLGHGGAEHASVEIVRCTFLPIGAAAPQCDSKNSLGYRSDVDSFGGNSAVVASHLDRGNVTIEGALMKRRVVPPVPWVAQLFQRDTGCLQGSA